ncbi:aromatic acid exporter family protein [Cytobacillus sp. IB215665]|uniref:aromatic acid exporter family protein n=1 Tax=Cytobacillus sp. IB215665 TaxID=3097357 RepID=UPI002A1634B8|nr:aromatic acid exporter family protein [Cytobacillus sp. IB215665]MDX8364323.1 aromatic acid exporter family protein [Cytobacillus sp. IB215665]
MFKIGYRTLKTALGITTSMALANFLQLENYISAGIITVLCIQSTKKESVLSSIDRFLACVVGIVFAFVFFEGIGYTPVSVGLLVLFFIPTTVMLRIQEGIITSIVIILHFYAAQQFTVQFVINELIIILIGILIALLVNIYMPSVEKRLRSYQQEVEGNFKRIFEHIVVYLRTNDMSWKGEEITVTDKLIQEAKDMALKDIDNRFLRKKDGYYHYFTMREKQFEIIERVLPTVTSITITVEQGEIIADFVEELITGIHPGNTAKTYLIKLANMKKQFEDMPLPISREEFEARASLLHFIKEMELYLIIKDSFIPMN